MRLHIDQCHCTDSNSPVLSLNNPSVKRFGNVIVYQLMYIILCNNCRYAQTALIFYNILVCDINVL